MRRIVEPPPIARCDRCGASLTLKRVDRLHAPGLSRNVFACTQCGAERAFVAHRDLYATPDMSSLARLGSLLS